MSSSFREQVPYGQWTQERENEYSKQTVPHRKQFALSLTDPACHCSLTLFFFPPPLHFYHLPFFVSIVVFFIGVCVCVCVYVICVCVFVGMYLCVFVSMYVCVSMCGMCVCVFFFARDLMEPSGEEYSDTQISCLSFLF